MIHWLPDNDIYMCVCVCAKRSQSDAQDPVVHVRWLMKILNPAYSKIISNTMTESAA